MKHQERKHGLSDTRPYRGTYRPNLTTEYRRAAGLTRRGDTAFIQGGFLCGGDHTLTAFSPLAGQPHSGRKDFHMAFFNSAVDVLQTLVIALGAGLGIWGVINLMEGYGNDNPGANAHVR